MADPALQLGRALVVDHLQKAGRSADARIVASGGGDDFAEVTVAVAAFRAASERADRLERALRCYADDGFWDDQANGTSLAFYDQGEVARAALLGKELYNVHRD